MNDRTRFADVTDDVEDRPWTKAFAAKDPEAFAAAFDENVVLEASALHGDRLNPGPLWYGALGLLG